MAPKLRPSTKLKTYKSLGIKSTNPTVQANAEWKHKTGAIQQWIRRRNKRRGKPTIGAFPRVCSATWPFGVPEPPPPKVVPYNSNN